jgi:exodeoxyribonuclease V alpha subunit
MSALADPFDARRAVHASGLLRVFNDAGVLAAADVHVALRLAALGGEADEQVVLAAALAVRAPRVGHVLVDLRAIHATATVDVDDSEPDLRVDLAALPWPPPSAWVERVAASGVVAAGEDAADRPLRLVGSALYLDRYWREERRVAADLQALAEAEPAQVRLGELADGLGRLFAGQDDDRQRLAAAAAVLRRLAIVAGGPGTGKTTTVARIVALLAEQSRGEPLVALAAPTGKAAARLEEAVHAEAATLAVSEGVRAQLLGLRARTLHRLLGRRAGFHSRFRHDRGNRLPHDVVIVDETSMVSLGMMARLVEAVRPDARLILVGDPGQLTSIEAGAVLGDLVGPAASGLRMRPAMRARLAEAAGVHVPAAAGDVAIGDGIVVLDRAHRFGSAIAGVAEAIRRGDGDAAVAALEGGEGVEWIRGDAEPLVESAAAAARAVMAAARTGHAGEALSALGAFRVLCAHRRGPHGVAAWAARIQARLAQDVDGLEGEWYAGRPLLATANDYGIGLFNGDTGVVVAREDLVAAFERGGRVLEIAPSRLGAVETVFAMTVHKSQGSQFDAAALVLPPPSSRLLTRELLYTAVTRARTRLIVAGTEDAIRTAVGRPVARASGLGERMWTPAAPTLEGA